MKIFTTNDNTNVTGVDGAIDLTQALLGTIEEYKYDLV